MVASRSAKGTTRTRTRKKFMSIKSIPEQIKSWRQAKGLSQPEAAKKLNCPVGTLQGWEQGRFEPNAMAINALILQKVIEKP